MVFILCRSIAYPLLLCRSIAYPLGTPRVVLRNVAMSSATLRCRCGEVEGQLADAAPDKVTRIVCYCDDCQAFLHQIGRADLLDANGGTDIVQVAPSTLRITRGADRIVGLRLGPKGLFRWHTTCCQTPMGNTLSPSVPFIGIVAQGFDATPGGPDAAFGQPIGKILGKFAIGTPPPGSTGLNVRLILRAVRSILGWRLRGKTWPHPFYDQATSAPKHPVTVLSKSERDALRPKCGPRPAAA